MDNTSQDQARYTRVIAAQLASISLEFLERCETERLIEIRRLQEGERMYNARDIRRLALIRRLNEDLGIDFSALEVVLHLRSQLVDLHEKIQEIERRQIAREEQLISELVQLRQRLAEDADWS